jgi:hypothetical protein
LPQSAVVPISYQVQTAVIPFDAKASRLELFVRIIWGLLLNLVFFVYALCYGIIILLYGIIAGILNVINFFIILITAKSWKTAFNWQAKLAISPYYDRPKTPFRNGTRTIYNARGVPSLIACAC